MSKSFSSVRIDGRRYPVLERLRVGGQTLLVIERLGHFTRPTLKVVSRDLAQELRCLQVVPYSRQALSRLRLLRRISRPHDQLPSIITCHRQGDQIYLLTRWIDGPTVQDYLRDCQRGREPWPSALIVVRLLRGLALGLRLLHDRLGVVHGDIHPGNLILCRHTKRLVPIDFGSAWNVERGAVRALGDGAHRSYAAPELFARETHVGSQADQFSAMAVGYALLTGEVPYDGLGGRAATLPGGSQTVALTPPSRGLQHPKRLPRDLRRSVDVAFERALAILANDRFPTTRDWIDALSELLARLEGRSSNESVADTWLLRRVHQFGTWLGYE